MIDRSIPPQIQKITRLQLPQAQRVFLQNGIPVYQLNQGSQEVLKIELLFEAGRWWEQELMTARSVAKLIKGGSLNKSNAELVEQFEFYGSSLHIVDDFDHISIKLYCLNKHLEQILPLLLEVLVQAVFPEKELSNFKQRSLQQLALNLRKNDVVAYRLFTELIFGKEHPYGYNSTETLIKQLERSAIIAHYKRCFCAENCKLIISGKIRNNVLTLLDKYLGQIPSGQSNKDLEFNRNFLVPAAPRAYHHSLDTEQLQASIRIGRTLFNRKHIDYNHCYMMNMVLGGFFGARLMQNLREDKAITYGVYSSLESLTKGGYFHIYTDVNLDVKDLALAEIYKEIERLQNDPIPKEELTMIRNYTMGMLLNALDGPFNASGVWRDLLAGEQSLDNFNDFVESIILLKAKDIQEMAQKYLRREDLCEIVIT